jgi:hypothetical protein
VSIFSIVAKMNFTQLSGTRFFKGFLPLFYVITPKESSFEALEHVPNYVGKVHFVANVHITSVNDAIILCVFSIRQFLISLC